MSFPLGGGTKKDATEEDEEEKKEINYRKKMEETKRKKQGTEEGRQNERREPDQVRKEAQPVFATFKSMCGSWGSTMLLAHNPTHMPKVKSSEKQFLFGLFIFFSRTPSILCLLGKPKFPA